MDEYEERALRLETKQNERLSKCTKKETFWDHFEMTTLFATARYRRFSKTYLRSNS